MTVELRRATPDDQGPIAAAAATWFARDLSSLLHPLFLQHFSGTSWVAVDAAGLAGFVVGFVSADVPGDAYVHLLAVRPDQRGSGLGGRLHDQFAAGVIPFGATLVRAVTGPTNLDSIAFHRRLGFSVGELVDGRVPLSRPVPALQGRFAARPDPRPGPDPWPSPLPERWPVAAGTRLDGTWVQVQVSDAALDASGLLAALDDDDVWAYGRGRPSTVAGYRALIDERFSIGWCPWTVRLRRAMAGVDAGSVVGTSSFLEVSHDSARAEIGATMYARPVWGTAVNPETKLLLLGYAFEALGWARVQFKVDIRNVRSQQAVARLGARFEGVMRRHQRRQDGSLRDSVLFSVTVDDWPRVRGLLEARLATVA